MLGLQLGKLLVAHGELFVHRFELCGCPGKLGFDTAELFCVLGCRELSCMELRLNVRDPGPQLSKLCELRLDVGGLALDSGRELAETYLAWRCGRRGLRHACVALALRSVPMQKLC